LQTILTGEKLPCYTQNIRKKHHFPEKTIIQIDPVNNRSYSLITVKTKDRHGLLATIARILAYHKLRVRFAKINTLADRTEDYFHVSNDNLKPINEASLRQRLIQDLYEALG
jgi:UTP:GlnB (protein PII) uridylyltransferase